MSGVAQLEVSTLERNQALIEEFIRSLGTLSPGRRKKYRYTLGKVSRKLGCPFKDVSQDQLKDFVDTVNSSELEESTKRDYRLLAKKFFGWLHGRELVEWIRLGNIKTRIGPEDILSEDELSYLRHATASLRDKALLEALYETACRPHEFLGLKKSNVSFDDYGAVVYVEKGKTGPRRIRVVNAAPLLANWIENHPLKAREAPLWVDLSSNTKYRSLRWIGLKRLVQRLGKAARIEKRVHPYIFRHTRLTHLARFMTEAQLCEFAGWEQGSGMPRMYVHLSGRDVDDALLKAYGLKSREEVRLAEAPHTCVRCGHVCESSAETCVRCGMALTLEAALKKDEEIRSLMKELAEAREFILKAKPWIEKKMMHDHEA